MKVHCIKFIHIDYNIAGILSVNSICEFVISVSLCVPLFYILYFFGSPVLVSKNKNLKFNKILLLHTLYLLKYFHDIR